MSMKKRPFPFLLLAVLGVMSSCDNSDPEIIVEPVDPLPVRMEMQDLTRELVYNASGKLWKVKSMQHLPGGDLEGFSEFIYDGSGKLTGATIDAGNPESDWKVEYTFENDLIVRTDEYINGTLSQYILYSYSNGNKLAESVTWQDVGEEFGILPVSKTTFDYDAAGNVTESKIYYYNTGTEQHELLTRFTYSNYDNKINSEEFFNVQIHNPLARLSSNNPGKMVIENKNQIVTQTDVYTYEYDADYMVKKNTESTLYNGQTGSYLTTYHFE